MAELPTHPVDLDRVTDAESSEPDTTFDGAEGPTIMAMAEALPCPDSAPSRAASPAATRVRDASRTVSGYLDRGPEDETAGVFDDPPPTSGPRPYDSTASFERSMPPPADVQEPTRAFDAPVVVNAGTDVRTQGPMVGESLAGSYRVEAVLGEDERTRVCVAIDLAGRPVLIRTFQEPETVRNRAAWRDLREAFASGADLPALLRVQGVVPLVDLVDDARYGPAVVTSALPGGTLAAEASRPPVMVLTRCFAQVARVIATAHAHGVTVGRFSADDIVLDEFGTPHLDLVVAAFSDALDVRQPGLTSPSDDVAWLGRAIESCLAARLRPSGTEELATIARACQRSRARPTAREVCARLEASQQEAIAVPWPKIGLLGLGIVLALGGGWIAGGGLPSKAVGSQPIAASIPLSSAADITAVLERAQQAADAGAVLEAGQIYRRWLADHDTANVRQAWQRLRRSRPFRRSLKELKKRLAAARRLTPEVRRDVEILRVLQPESLVLKHWLARMEKPTGGAR